MLSTHYRIGKAIGISVNLLANGKSEISACGITIENNKLNIDKKLIGIDHVDELKKHYPQHASVSINLVGKGILQKQTEQISEINAETFTQILPNGNPEDFYVQNFVSGRSSFVSIIRKTEADKWIEAFTNLGFTTLILSLGAFPVQNIIEQVNFYDKDIAFDGHHIERNEVKEWLSYTYSTKSTAGFPLKISAEPIHEKILLAYAAAFQLALSSDIDLVCADVKGLETKLVDLLEEKKFKVRGFVALCFFFVLLLINFFIFSWLSLDNDRLIQQISVSTKSVSDIEVLTQQVDKKEKLLNTLGWDNGLNKARLFDQLASLMPEEIRLMEMAVNPVDAAAMRMEKTISFSNKILTITGNSENILPLNEWIARIKILKWVKTVEMDSYTFNSELATGQFVIKITY